MLSHNIGSAFFRKELSRIVLKRNCPILSHLFFADDSILFIMLTDSNLQSLLNILKDFSLASGQLVNFGKLEVLLSTNASEEDYISVCSVLGFL